MRINLIKSSVLSINDTIITNSKIIDNDFNTFFVSSGPMIARYHKSVHYVVNDIVNPELTIFLNNKYYLMY